MRGLARIAGVVVAVVLAGSGCASGKAEAPGADEAPEAAQKHAHEAPGSRTVRVEIARIEATAAEMKLRLPGEVEGSRDALLGAALGGFVERVAVDEGDRVRKGQLLARVDSQLYAAQIERTEAELAAARRELARTKQMAGAVPQSQQDAAETRVKTAEAANRTAHIQASRALIRAPFAGVVADVTVEQGEIAPPGSPIVRLVQLDPVDVTLSVADRDVVALEPGTEVKVHTDARGAIYEGRISHISPAANLKTRTFEVKVHVDNPDGELLPGMIATVEIRSDVKGDRVVLPQYILVTARDGNGVFVVDDGKARWRPVKLGPVVGGQVVVDEGVSAGDQVVVTGHRELADGDPVIVARSGSCCVDGRVQFEEK